MNSTQMFPDKVLAYAPGLSREPWPEARAKLASEVPAVKLAMSRRRPMGLVLPLSRPNLSELGEARETAWLRRFLEQNDLFAVSLDASRSDSEVPDWTCFEQVEFSIALAELLAELLEDENEGSLSSVPLMRQSVFRREPGAFRRSAEHLAEVAAGLARLEDRTGKWIHLDLVPQPGYALQDSSSVVRFFEEFLYASSDAEWISRYVRVGHDCCHASVAFEDPELVFARYESSGIEVGKIRLCSATRVNFDELSTSEQPVALAQLRELTTNNRQHGGAIRPSLAAEPFLFEDVTDPLRRTSSHPEGEWRVGLHVPPHVAHLGLVETTQSDVTNALACAPSGVRHLELASPDEDHFPDDLEFSDPLMSMTGAVEFLSDWVLAVQEY